MRRLIFAAALSLAALSVPAHGQPACDRCPPPRPPFPIYGFIDIPSRLTYTPYAPGFYLAGWTVDCRSGAQPPFVAVLDHDLRNQTTTWLPSFLIFRELSRPDVRAAFLASCPAIGSNTRFGYAVYPNAILSSGRHALTVFWSTGDGLAQSMGVSVEVP